MERSDDLQAWTVVAERQGAGDSQALLNFTAQDAEPLNGVSYYRPRQVDTDGISTLSQPVPVNRANAVNVAVHPVPFTDNLTVEVAENELLSIDLFSVSGQRLVVDMSERAGRVVLNTARLPAGIHVINVRTPQGPFRSTNGKDL